MLHTGLGMKPANQNISQPLQSCIMSTGDVSLANPEAYPAGNANLGKYI